MTDQEIQEQAEKYANSIVPNPSKYDAPFHTTADRHDDITETWIDSAKWMQEQDEWISVEILPVAGTECYFIVQFTNEFGLQNIQHTGIFGALGFTSYHDSENYSIKEVTKHFPLPSPPKTK